KLVSLGVEESVLQQPKGGESGPPTLAVRSPAAGVVIHADVKVGQVVEPTEHLFEIVDLSKVWIKVGVPESDLRRVRAGQGMRLRLAAYPGEEFATRVEVPGLFLDPQTRLGTVWAELANPPGRPARLLPGMAGQAEVVLPPSRAVTVPAAALVIEGAERYVFVQEGPGQYLRRDVVVGLRKGGTVQVLEEGLLPGEWVVTAGSHELASYFVQGTLRLSPTAARSSRLRVEKVRRRPVAEVMEINAVVDLPPNRRAVSSTRLAGTVHRIHVDRGQAV